MKRVIGAIVIASISLSAFAQDEQVNCDNVKIMMRTQHADKFNIKATWKTKAEFPAEPKTIVIGDGNLTSDTDVAFNIQCPDFTAVYDGNMLEMKAKSYSDVVEHIPPLFGQTIRLYSHSWYTYPNIRQGSVSDTYNFDLKTLRLKRPSLYYTDEAVIGYKVDSSSLKPLLYSSKVHDYEGDFDAANVIDIYHKNSKTQEKGEAISRIYVDKSNGILRIYKNYDFPES